MNLRTHARTSNLVRVTEDRYGFVPASSVTILIRQCMAPYCNRKIRFSPCVSVAYTYS